MNLRVLAAGVFAAAVGGELFVRGAVGLAAWARVPAGIIGATLAAFATSSPELSVVVQSAMAGAPVIALGNAIGSNVINISCVLGIVLVTGPLAVDRRELRRELSFAAVAPVLTLLALVDAELVALEGVVLLRVFVGWLVLVINAARKARQDAVEELGASTRWAALTSSVAGLALLVLDADGGQDRRSSPARRRRDVHGRHGADRRVSHRSGRTVSRPWRPVPSTAPGARSQR